jgi:hypothetical protein
LKGVFEMGLKIEKFWSDHKNFIKNVTIGIAVPMAIVGVMALCGVRNLNQFLEEKGLSDEYYCMDEIGE